MTSSGRPKLGDVFRGENPDRVEGLAGLLPPGPAVRPVLSRPVAVPPLPAIAEAQVTSDPTSVAESAPAKPGRGSGVVDGRTRTASDRVDRTETTTAASSDSSARKLRKVAPGEKGGAATPPLREGPAPKARASTVKTVPANIDMTVHQDLRRFALRTELSFATIALRAIEAHAQELAQLWQAPPVRTGLFASVQERPGNRRAEPAAQVQLRMQAADAAVLDGLVADWAAPSRSALVNEALKLYLPSETTR